MSKKLFTADFEINASAKMLFPYLNTASGLAQWMADDVTVRDGIFNFIWDEEDHTAKIVAERASQYVKFEFFPEDEEDENDPLYIELKLETNDLTGSLFLKISDYSDIDDQEEQYELWESLVLSLKEIVGG